MRSRGLYVIAQGQAASTGPPANPLAPGPHGGFFCGPAIIDAVNGALILQGLQPWHSYP